MILFQTSKGEDIQLASIVDTKGRTIYSVRRHFGGRIRFFAVRMHNKEYWWVAAESPGEFSKRNHERRVFGIIKYEEWQSLPDIACRVLTSPEFA